MKPITPIAIRDLAAPPPYVRVPADDVRAAVECLADVSEQTPPDHRAPIEALIKRLGGRLNRAPFKPRLAPLVLEDVLAVVRVGVAALHALGRQHRKPMILEVLRRATQTRENDPETLIGISNAAVHVMRDHRLPTGFGTGLRTPDEIECIEIAAAEIAALMRWIDDEALNDEIEAAEAD